MRNCFLVIKYNFQRLLKEKMAIFMLIIILPLLVGLGVCFSTNDDVKGNIAVVGANMQQEEIIKKTLNNNERINIDFLQENVSKTDLIKGIYLAEVEYGEEDAKVTSYKNEEFKKSLEAILNNEIYEMAVEEVTVEGKIIGFLVMFLLMGSILILDYYLIDREKGVYSRILMSETSYYEYVIGQILYVFLAIAVPTIIMSVLVIKVLSVQLNISLWSFCGLLVLVSFLASSFAMFWNSTVKSKAAAQMGSSIVIMITSLLGGCIVNISDNNRIMKFIRGFIPQKRMIDLADNFNNGDLIFIMITIGIFIFGSVVIGKYYCDRGEFI